MKSGRKPRWIVPGAIILITTSIFISIVFLGYYNVSVPSGHFKATEYILSTTMKNAVKNHAKDIEVPDSIKLSDPIFARSFFGHYHAACRSCHGAPGRNPDPWMVLYPKAADLTDKNLQKKWSEPELFWIIKNGIKDTGMIALGPTHTDDAIWGVTALVSQLSQMTAQEYNEMEAWFQAHRDHH